MTDELLNQTMKCVDMVQSVLDGSGENEYMDRVTKLRHVIDRYYGEKNQQFCGS